MEKSHVRMRTADPDDADFHLLEVVARPPACVNGHRIAVWVYREEGNIREIVLAGHAEPSTCQRATACLIRAAESLDGEIDMMLTCGAAHFRVPEDLLPPQDDAEDPFADFDELAAEFGDLRRGREAPEGTRPRHIQAVLGTMIQELQELVDETGLVELYERPWNVLTEFREDYRKRMRSSSNSIFLPPEPTVGQVAALVPIIPGDDADGDPLVFRLEGWDFDCPEYQLVAYRHLSCMRRELLRDALHRRQTYRSWLKEWMEDWVHKIMWLPTYEAMQIRLAVPGPAGKQAAPQKWAELEAFLRDDAASFLDRGQSWHRFLEAVLASAMKSSDFRSANAPDLDTPIQPSVIIDVDYERGIKTTRQATKYDHAYTWRERILHHDPHMISTCLTYIRRMDAIIKPYQDMDVRSRVGRDSPANAEQRKARVLNDISRSIVLESMVRGWPSFFLDDDKDRKNFAAWASEYRSHIWSIMAEQAEEAGVALDVLLEDNIIYDVRFNEDLGCTIQPLMLLDDAVHAQVHGPALGASAVVPLWSRSTPNDMTPDVLALGTTNSERARELVARARRHCGEAEVDLQEAAECLRLALACHPAVAGREILVEWSRRLGRDTREEFERAKPVIEAATLCSKGRTHEVEPLITDYLAKETDPLPDAFVMAAMCELSAPGDNGNLRQLVLKRNAFVGQYKDSLSELKELSRGISDLDYLPNAGRLLPSLDTREFAAKRRELESLQTEITRLDDEISRLEHRRTKHARQATELIRQALGDPNFVRKKHPALANAAEVAPDLLRKVIETDCRYQPGGSEEYFIRYATMQRLIEVKGLFGIVRELSDIQHLVEANPQLAQRTLLHRTRELSTNLWLPDAVENDLRYIADEFAKGKWDRLLSNRVAAILSEGVATCLADIRDLMTDRLVANAPFAESLATRIYITQQFERNYRRTFELLHEAKVALGRAVTHPWKIVNTEVTELPADGQLTLHESARAIVLEEESQRTTLLVTEALSEEEVQHVAKHITDPEWTASLVYARSLAESLLQTDVEPMPQWGMWRDTMREVQRELLHALCCFGYRANILGRVEPSDPEKAAESERRMDRVVPRLSPTVDWKWSDLGSWADLLDPGVEREEYEPIKLAP